MRGAFAALAIGACAALAAARYDTAFKGYSSDKLNVHLISHTHDDVGWLKTLDEYYVGANNSIQHAGVQYILDSVVAHLQQNPDRKFIYVEQAFFQHWWFAQDAATRATVRGLVASGQLAFTNGGWCMHDEANPTYVDMVDQTTLGNRYLLQEFGVVPSVTWQIDPFGHTATQQAEQTALSGYDAVYFARIDYQDKALRAKDRRLEMLWQASPDLGAGAQSFAGVLYYHYCPPPGLNFDLSNPGATPVVLDSRLEGVQPSANAILETFLSDAATQAAAYSGGHIAFTMGCDFQYEQAGEWYANLDALLHVLNANGSVNAFYSTPAQYTAAKSAANVSWSLKTDDFMPYADQPYSYWTGYFTSRPALKGYVRTESAYLQGARALLLAANATGLGAGAARRAASRAPSARDAVLPQSGPGAEQLPPWFATSISHLEHAMGTAQHHDAVAGTEKQHVAFDYAKKLYRGHADAAAGTDEVLTHLTGGAGGWAECRLANVSRCDATAKGTPTVLSLTNPTGQERTVNVRLPVGVPSGVRSWAVSNASAHALHAQLTPSSSRDNALRAINGGSASAPIAWLAFQVRLPAYGFTSAFLVPVATAAAAPLTHLSAPPAPALRGGDVTLDNGVAAATVSGATGLLARFSNRVANVSATTAVEWRWYNSSTGNTCSGPNCPWGATQASGAYIFRPNTTTARDFPVGAAAATLTAAGPVVWEVTHTVGAWVTAVTRLWAGSPLLELQYTVGPIPIGDGLGKEVIHRISSDVASGAEWATDANGRSMQARTRNERPSWPLNVTNPVAGNYYPVNAALRLTEAAGAAPRSLTVLNDRSQGGSSLASGQAELMVHRRLLHDDRRGVGEALNETGLTGQGLIVRGSHWLSLERAGASAAAAARAAQQDAYFAPLAKLGPLAGLTPAQWGTKFTAARAGLRAPLPPSLHLLTVDTANYGPGRALLRLAHLFEKADGAWAAPVTVQLATLFAGLDITAATEQTLRGNQDLTDYKPLPFTAAGAGGPATPLLTQWASTPPSGAGLAVTLRPMEIRTFLVDLAPAA